MLTVADILALEQLELTLVAGAGNVSVPVRWVHSSELADPTPWLRGGELLLTTGQPLESDPAAYVELLAGRGLAGLGLGLGFGFEELPGAARAAADRLGFPIFTIPYRVPVHRAHRGGVHGPLQPARGRDRAAPGGRSG